LNRLPTSLSCNTPILGFDSGETTIGAYFKRRLAFIRAVGKRVKARRHQTHLVRVGHPFRKIYAATLQMRKLTALSELAQRTMFKHKYMEMIAKKGRIPPTSFLVMEV